MNKLTLGTVQFGIDYGINNSSGKVSKDEVFKILKYAEDNGIDLLDTSYAYGESETVLGEYIKKSPPFFKVISKLPRNDRKNKINIFFESIKKLHINKFYGYLLHHFDFFLRNPEIWEFFKILKKEEKAEKTGFVLYYPHELEYLRKKKIEFDIVQIPYSVLDQRFSPYFLELKEKNIEIHVRSVFLQGLVFKRWDRLEKQFLKIKNKLKTIDTIARELNIPISALYLNFAILNPLIDRVIIGVDSIMHLKENLANLKYIDKVKPVYEEISLIKEEDENIIVPVNWRERMVKND